MDGRFHFFADAHTPSSSRSIRVPNDDDNDGKLNEDAEGNLDPNRNWGYDWKPKYVQSGAGNFPLQPTP